jgi:hypothetical protein
LWAFLYLAVLCIVFFVAIPVALTPEIDQNA